MIEKEIAAVVEANQDTANWEAIDYEERSMVEEVTTVTGIPYLLETIPLRFEVPGG